MTNPIVGVVMGSSSDWDTMQHAVQILEQFGVPHEARVVSAHRMPDDMFAYAEGAAARGLKAIIAGAGGAAHLPGMLAAKTLVPVLGVPVASRHLQGVDSLHSIVQMPKGVPVATFAIGAAGAANAALFAVAMLAGDDAALRERLAQFGALVGQQGHGKQGGVGSACGANGKRGHGNALGHLHDAVQRVHALQVAAGHGHAQHGHSGLGRDHARKVGSTASARDDGLQASACGGFGVGKHVVGHAVGRDHAGLVCNAELLKNLHCVLHGVPVAAGTHDDADLDGFHGVWGWRCGCAEQPLAMDGTRDFTFCVPPRHIRWQAWAKIARTCL